MIARELYVKPVVMQLHYSSDPSVTIATSCKTTQSASGPVTSGCLNAQATLPCNAVGQS